MTTQFSNISATTSPFVLPPGTYDLDVHAAGYGTAVTLQKLAIDGTSWLTAVANFAADGVASGVYLAGTYRVLITGATGVYINVASVVQY